MLLLLLCDLAFIMLPAFIMCLIACWLRGQRLFPAADADLPKPREASGHQGSSPHQVQLLLLLLPWLLLCVIHNLLCCLTCCLHFLGLSLPEAASCCLTHGQHAV